MELAQTAARAGAERTRVAEGLPTRRRAEAEAAEALRRHIVAGEGLNEEERRVEAARRTSANVCLNWTRTRPERWPGPEAAIPRFNEEARAIAPARKDAVPDGRAPWKRPMERFGKWTPRFRLTPGSPEWSAPQRPRPPNRGLGPTCRELDQPVSRPSGP